MTFFKKKHLIALLVGGVLLIPNATSHRVFADSVTMVTIGENLNQQQRDKILDYFGVEENEVDIRIVTNKEERKYLEGLIPEEQIGHKTYSCAYIQQAPKGSGINIKLSNLTYVTPNMIRSAIASLSLKEYQDLNIVGASVIPASGSGFLCGVLTSLEANGATIDEDKKEIANEEVFVTGNLGEDIGKDKATGVINDIKTEIIKNNTKDTVQIAETITNVTNNYNITLTSSQQKEIQGLMEKVAKEDYNYEEVKGYLKDIKQSVNATLSELGEKVNNTDFFEKVGFWFESIGDWFKQLFTKEETSILEETNDSALGNVVISNSTDDTTPSDMNNSEKESIEQENTNIFERLWNWFTGLFNNSDSDNSTDSIIENETIEQPLNDLSNTDDNEATDTEVDPNTEGSTPGVTDSKEEQTIEDELINDQDKVEVEDTLEESTEIQSPTEEVEGEAQSLTEEISAGVNSSL